MRKILILIACFLLSSLTFLTANPPVNLTTTIFGNDVIITWSDSHGADEYNVYSSQEAYNNFSQIATYNDTAYTETY